MNIYFKGIHARFVHCVASAVLAVPGDEAPRLRLIRIIDIIKLLSLVSRVVGRVWIVASMVATLARFLFH